MAFITGTASSFADLRTNLIAGCVANGWSNSGNILWKGNSYFEITSATTYVQIYGGTGQSGGVISGKSPNGARLGGSYTTFPITYDLHILTNPDEVYLVVNYNTDSYQQISFGTTSIDGGGYGPWFTGAHHTETAPSSNNGMNVANGFYYISSYCYATVATNSLGLFNYASWTGEVAASFVYTTANGTPGWYGYSSGATSARLSNGGSASLVAALLNSTPVGFNSGSILLPIKATLDMGSNGRAVVASLAHARFCRIDNNLPGDIISYGSEQWKLYPWLRKSTTSRDGINNATTTPPNHSGTLGYAIRYTGA